MTVFVGRERELAQLRAGLDAAFGGDGAFILVTGDAGIGKTTLANEFGREAVQRGARVLRGGNFEGGRGATVLAVGPGPARRFQRPA